MFSSILRHLQRPHSDERGQVLIIAVMLMGVLAGGAAIAVDTGAYMAHRRDVQNAADSIALAASQVLPDANAAHAIANEWADRNGVEPGEMTVTITPQNLPATPNPSVTIELTAAHNLTFLKLLGRDSADINTTATAIRTSPGGSNGLMPWSVLEAVKNAAVPGDAVVLKYDSTNVLNGNFGALRIDGNGANIYRNSIKFGSDNGLCAVTATDCTDPSIVQTQPGNMTGPTRQGTDYRINNTTIACDTWLEVVVENLDGTQGLRPECNPFTNGGDPGSLRVIIVPVIDSLCNGACYVTILEFSLFFLEGYGAGGCTGNDCEIEGRFIASNTNYGALTGTFDPDTFAHFVRLVE